MTEGIAHHELLDEPWAAEKIRHALEHGKAARLREVVQHLPSSCTRGGPLRLVFVGHNIPSWCVVLRFHGRCCQNCRIFLMKATSYESLGNIGR